jgi:hypothetical protein
MRDRATINRLKMYKNSKPVRDKVGKIIKAAPFQVCLLLRACRLHTCLFSQNSPPAPSRALSRTENGLATRELSVKRSYKSFRRIWARHLKIHTRCAGCLLSLTTYLLR